jgi:putative DNA primase/helicase
MTQGSVLYTGPTVEDLDRIPDALTARRQWVLWRGVDTVDAQTGEIRLNKIPINPQSLKHADSTNPRTWGTFDRCVAALPVALEEWAEEDAAAYRGGGIGFVFTDTDPYVGIDLDHCRDPDTGVIEGWARTHIETLTSYTEISPSGTGVHIIVEGSLPPTGRKKGPVEMYSYARFFTMTGAHLPATPATLTAHQPAINALWCSLFGPQVGQTVWTLDSHGTITNSDGKPWEILRIEAAPDGEPYAFFAETSAGVSLIQCEVVRTPTGTPAPATPALADDVLLAKARSARNGTRFARLWAGDTSLHQDDDSSADLALCCMLAFWTQDGDQLDRLFRQSGLMRKKWDAKRGEQTYGQRTMAEALARQTEHYTSGGAQLLVGGIQQAQAGQNGQTSPTAATFDLAVFQDALKALPDGERLPAVLAQMETLARLPRAIWMQAKQTIKALIPTCNLHDLEAVRKETREALQAQHQAHARAALPPWRMQLLCTKAFEPQQTLRNLVLALQNLDPWHRAGCWYDLVRDRHMVGERPVEDEDAAAAGVRIEEVLEMRVTNVALVGRALDHVCRQAPRDLLQEWVDTLPAMPVTDLLTTWLRTYAKVPDEVPDAYVEDVSRIIPVGMIARILHPGCQYRYVPIFEGEENAGKSELAKALAGEDAYGRSWYVPLSAGLEGKEAHMMLEGALIAELADLSSYTKTDENRMKALVTARTDSFVPKFANKRVDHPRRTIFIATVNPEGDGAYLKGQTGNTRYLPIPVHDIDLAKFQAIRTQLFAEAKAYYLAHPTDWWQLTCEVDAAQEREARRQSSVYEGSLAVWLQNKASTTWEEIAEYYLLLEAKERWKDRGLQMEIAKALHALQWRVKQEWDGATKRNRKVWRPR